MQEFLKWTLEAIRKDGSQMSWMEEKRVEWVPLAASMLQNLLNGHAIIILTDNEREWFEHYILQVVNHHANQRPLLPFFSLKTFFPSLDSIKTKDDLELLENMLDIAFPLGYIVFYIGKGNDPRSQIAQRKDNNFLWVMDEDMQNSFHLRSSDEMLDIKLIQLYRLLDKSINALLFAQVSLNESK